jgi:hypothetical protein
VKAGERGCGEMDRDAPASIGICLVSRVDRGHYGPSAVKEWLYK